MCNLTDGTATETSVYTRVFVNNCRNDILFKTYKTIPSTAASSSPQVSTPNKGYTVLSTLKFAGQERIGGGQLMPTDRGRYTCQFGNEVAKTDTTMLLRIEHSPVVVHHHNR